ncbi:dimethylargininase [Streptomyces candidus]|uniref:N-dimethylarginine dimethylaminohydrolase n=1 Tax=Streptomyces candidus TaxID=67283 RepID=A0A7X0HAA2_9ACTN|nr:N-dimethylarginine dimethylaminohydrolase [Streptomyces candidus]GHH34117.1 amidinotransferase [Streptomyces candidus]
MTPRIRDCAPRRYLMCPPEHFRVTYSINPWMDPAKPVELPLALAQWEDLRDRYLSLGHTVELLAPRPDLPDMVFAANGATVVDGRVLGSRFAYAERTPEAEAHRAWFRAHGFTDLREPEHVNEGEGDFAVTASWLLAGRGFRSTSAAHDEAQEFFGRPVIGLDLVDPRYYHLDTALAVLDDRTDEVMYYPGAFSPGSRAVLARLFPDAVIAEEADAAALGLNAVSDGRHVLLPQAAAGLFGPLRARGFEPIGMDLGELLKGGGSVKCCTQELRPHAPGPRRAAPAPLARSGAGS